MDNIHITNTTEIISITTDRETIEVKNTVGENIEIYNIRGLKGNKGDTGEQGAQGIQGEKGDKGDAGADGDSAYQVAVNNGFVGTEQEWLDSLQGEDGQAANSDFAEQRIFTRAEFNDYTPIANGFYIVREYDDTISQYFENNLMIGEETVDPALFFPTQIENNVLWLDAADSDTVADVGDSVLQWLDKSGNSYNASQATASQQPKTNTKQINGLNALDFVGSGKQLELPAGLMAAIGGANNSTVFAVGAKTNELEQSDAFLADQSRYRLLLTNDGGYFRLKSSGGATVSFKVVGTNQHIVAGQREGNIARFWYEGGIPAVDNSQVDTTLTQLRIAHLDQNFDGKIAEIIIYNRVLNADEMNQVGNYLKSKWGAVWTDV